MLVRKESANRGLPIYHCLTAGFRRRSMCPCFQTTASLWGRLTLTLERGGSAEDPVAVMVLQDRTEFGHFHRLAHSLSEKLLGQRDRNSPSRAT